MKSRAIAMTVCLCGALAALSGCATGPAALAAADTDGSALEQCDQITGSRIRGRDPGRCEPVGHPFRSYTAEELALTGEIDLVEALRQLDPSFQ
jgi:hypothetical protein